MKQISLKEFLKSPISEQIKYTSLLSHVKPKELIKVNIQGLSYNDVKMLFKEITKPNPNLEFIFTKSLDITKVQYLSMPIQNFFILKKYIEEFFVNLKNNEVRLLQSIDSDYGLWETAGGNELNEFADVLPLSQLAKIYGGYPFELGNKAYQEVIYLLRMNNKQGQVEMEYNKLKSKQK